MPIYIDSHEPIEIIDYLKHRKLAVEVKHLESGDYAFGDVGIERKTVTDLTNSLFNKRLWNQLDTLRRTYPINILIVEGWTGVQSADKYTLGVITTLLLNWKQQIIFTYNWLETAKYIEALFIKYGVAKSNKGLPAVVKKQKTVKDIQLEMLQTISGIGVSKAKEILKRNPYIFSLHQKYLPSLEGIKGLRTESKELLIKLMRGEE